MKKQIQILIYSLFLSMILVSFLNCNDTKGDGTKQNDLKTKLDSFVKATDKIIAENNFNDTVIKDETDGINSESQVENTSNTGYKLEGKLDTIVIEFDENNRLLIPDIHPSVYADENPVPEMYKDYSFVQTHDKIDFELGIAGLDGTVRGNELLFETNEDFKITGVFCYTFSGIFFSEDGSGGMWEEFESEKSKEYPAEQLGEFDFAVPEFKVIEDVIPSDLIAEADAKVKENELLSYEFLISEVDIKVQYSIKNKNYKKLLVFKYDYGD